MKLRRKFKLRLRALRSRVAVLEGSMRHMQVAWNSYVLQFITLQTRVRIIMVEQGIAQPEGLSADEDSD